MDNDFINPDQLILQFGLEEGMKAADFGIGSGYFTILMAKKVGETGLVTALDILEAPLEVVKNKAVAEGLENINFVRANLEAENGSKLENDSQDFVLLANILFQSEKEQDIIKEASRVVKSGGKVVVIDWKQNVSALGGPPEELKTPPSEVKSFAEAAGLKFANEFDAGKYHYGVVFNK